MTSAKASVEAVAMLPGKCADIGAITTGVLIPVRSHDGRHT
ncbi:hypothetical protein X734_31880 [Mesorhizobium sp. L2C084A000]|nr:hypothetical protein X734_31880 [Mesorhizobium sp. L2C084A000]